MLPALVGGLMLARTTAESNPALSAGLLAGVREEG
jgi:hypothetical protein